MHDDPHQVPKWPRNSLVLARILSF